MAEVINGKPLDAKLAEEWLSRLPQLEKEFNLDPELVAIFRERLRGN